MRLFITLLVATLSASILVMGCGKAGKKEVLVKIGKKGTITLEEFSNRISRLPKRYQTVVKKNKKQFLDEIIVDTLLYAEAVNRKVDKNKDVKRLVNEAKRKIMIVQLLRDEVDIQTDVNDEEMQNYYNENKEKFTTPEVLRASHVLLKTEDEAKDILVGLSNGRNFEDLARARSIDPTSKIGGDIGYFTKNQLVPEVEEVCFSMQPGEISGIVKSKFGYHVIKLTERKEPALKSFEEVKDVIKQSLGRHKKKVRFNELVESLREKSKIVINNDLLESISEEEVETPKE